MTFATATLMTMTVLAQEPKYTRKHFLVQLDTTEFKIALPENGNGKQITYLSTSPQIWDIDDDNTTFVTLGQNALIRVEGTQINHKRQGTFSFYLIDSLDHKKIYKIWEQSIKNDKLNGVWTTYTLKGTVAVTQTFKDDSLDGPTRNYWIDGTSIMSETDYFNGKSKYIAKEFFQNGKVATETPYDHGQVTGLAKRYYEDGSLKETANFKNSDFDGTRKYYYPNGQLWIEQIYKNGKSWTVVANFTSNGTKRNPGTLLNGNGTLIFYNEDGTIRETQTFVNGIQKK